MRLPDDAAGPGSGPLKGRQGGSPAGDPGGGGGGPLGPEEPPSIQPSPAQASAERSEQTAGVEVEADLEGLLKERDDYLELARRTKADFENFRKRMTGEVRAAGARGKGELARDIVNALDDLERAIEAAGLDPEGDSEDGLSHGVLLMFRSLRGALARNGIEAIDPSGQRFDPMTHEALSTQAAEGVEPGSVVEVIQKGYRLGDVLIRPARVVVSE
ncbi:MAG: nucleotide exchange factor GrpE [Solirubrobacterales bacterium]